MELLEIQRKVIFKYDLIRGLESLQGKLDLNF